MLRSVRALGPIARVPLCNDHASHTSPTPSHVSFCRLYCHYIVCFPCDYARLHCYRQPLARQGADFHFRQPPRNRVWTHPSLTATPAPRQLLNTEDVAMADTNDIPCSDSEEERSVCSVDSADSVPEHSTRGPIEKAALPVTTTPRRPVRSWRLHRGSRCATRAKSPSRSSKRRRDEVDYMARAAALSAQLALLRQQQAAVHARLHDVTRENAVLMTKHAAVMRRVRARRA